MWLNHMFYYTRKRAHNQMEARFQVVFVSVLEQ